SVRDCGRGRQPHDRHFHAGRTWAATNLRRYQNVPRGSLLERSSPVLRVLSWRQRGRSRGITPDKGERAGGRADRGMEAVTESGVTRSKGSQITSGPFITTVETLSDDRMFIDAPAGVP